MDRNDKKCRGMLKKGILVCVISLTCMLLCFPLSVIADFSHIFGAIKSKDGAKSTENLNEQSEILDSTEASTSFGKSEILFRDIEWGLPYKDVVGKIPADYWPSLEPDYASSIKNELIDPLAHIAFPDYVRGYTYAESDIDVAGYPVDLVRLWFAYTLDNDGMLQKDEGHTAFIEASYVFKPKNIPMVRDDLEQKLISVYGSPDESGDVDPDSFSDFDTYSLWSGDNEAIIVLETDSNAGAIRINYGWLKGDEYLQEAYQALVNKEASVSGDGNTDGL